MVRSDFPTPSISSRKSLTLDDKHQYLLEWHFGAPGYHVSTIGLNEAQIRE